MSATSTTDTNAVPALDNASSSSSSSSTTTTSADTNIASALEGGYLLESDEGMLTVPQRYRATADLLCPFQILDCNDGFEDLRQFKTHVFSHFKGHNAPETAACFLCDLKFGQSAEDHAAKAWNAMLNHLAQDHFRQGQRLSTIRTDFGLMRWMYTRKIIDNAEFKRTQMITRPVFISTGRQSARGFVLNLPTAPTPPLNSSRPSLPFGRTASLLPPSSAYYTHASQRAERRQREARPMLMVGHFG